MARGGINEFQDPQTRRLIDSLIQQSIRANNGSVAGGLASVLNQGLAGWRMGQDRRQRGATNKAMAEAYSKDYAAPVKGRAAVLSKGLTAGEANAMDDFDGPPPTDRLSAMDAANIGVEQEAPGNYKSVPDSEVLIEPKELEAAIPEQEGYDPHKRALSNLLALGGDNPYASRMAAQMGMQQAGADRDARLKAGLAATARQNAREDYLYQQQNKSYRPKVPVPGRDVPFSDAVQEQKVSIAQAGNPGAVAPGPGAGPGERPPVPRHPKTGQMILSPGQKKVDTEFGKTYAEFVAGGGIGDTTKNLAQVKDVITALRSGTTDMTGFYQGNAPRWMRAITSGKSLDAQEAVEEVVQRNLRLILGAQFTNEEGKRLIARAYNPRLDEATNAQRLERLVGAMETALQAKTEAAKYFQKWGTLAGYDGISGVSVDQIETMAFGKKSLSEKKKRLKYNMKTGEFE